MNLLKLIFSFLLINHVDTMIWYGTTTKVREPRVTLIGMFPALTIYTYLNIKFPELMIILT